MIELYLAVLLFGLGTYFNKKDVFKRTPQGQIVVKQGVDLDEIDAQNNVVEEVEPVVIQTAPVTIVTEKTSDAVNRLETDYAENLDGKCREIQKRDFSSYLDQKSKDLYRLRKLSETGGTPDADGELEHSGVLKYTPKTDNTVFSSLTGTNMPVNQFTSRQTIGKDGGIGSDSNSETWAVPYFGSVAKQNMNVEGFQNKLETFTGSSQFNFHKKETKNFFTPSRDVGYVNGSPIATDKMQDRMVQSKYRTGELPAEQVRVAPGLGQNYGNQGRGGFQQFEVSEIARPKNVDQLRTLSNPRITYTPPTVSGKSYNDRREATPRIAKNRTSKTFAQTEANLLKTTGAYLKGKAKENYIIKDTNRINSRSFYGSAAPVSSKRTYTTPKFKDSNKNIYGSSGVRNANLPHAWNSSSKNSDYGKGSFNLAPNERDVTQKRTHVSNFATLVKSIIAPLQDKLKGTRKEFIIGNPNPEGYFGADMPEKPTVYDPDDVARTTVKETTLEYDHEGHLAGPEKGTVHDPNDVARTTVKETTLEYDHEGHISGPEKITVYDPNDVARTTIKESTIHNKMHTVVSGAKKVSVYDPNNVAKTTIKETTEQNKYNGNLKEQVPSRPTDYNVEPLKTTIKETTENNEHVNNVAYVRGDGKGYLANDFFAPATLKQLTSDNEYEGNIYSSLFSSGGYLSNEFYAPATIKQYTSNFEYIGTAGSANQASTSYASAYNAITNSLREKVLRGRAPTQNGVKVSVGGDNINVSYNKQNANIPVSKTQRIARVAQINRDSKDTNFTSNRVALSNKAQKELYNPSQLNMLRKNPFAISLNRNFGASRGAGRGVFSDNESD